MLPYYHWQELLSATSRPDITDARIKLNAGKICMIELSSRGLIRVTGEDANRFLQSQLTNDINLVNPKQGQLSAYCTAKGRMLAVFRICMRSEGEYLLELPAVMLDSVMMRLKMFVLRSKVSLESANDLLTMGITGDDKLSTLAQLPENDYGQALNHGVTVIRIPGSRPRFQLVGAATAIKKFWQQNEATTCAADNNLWRWLDIQTAQPNIWPGTVERFTPHMLNLDLLNGVSFNKGCYPGQEIVARTKFLGKVKQRMIRARATISDNLQPGDAVFSKESPRQAAGYIVDAAPEPNGRWDLLATVKNPEQEEVVYLGAVDGPEIRLDENPYALN